MHLLDCLQQSEHHVKEFMVNPVLGKNAIGSDRSAVLSTGSWRNVEPELGSPESGMPATLSMAGNKTDMNRPHYENGLFSSSLSEALEKKCKYRFTASVWYVFFISNAHRLSCGCCFLFDIYCS